MEQKWILLEIGLKKCSKCGKIKPIENFDNCNKHPDGLAYKCKDCVKIYNNKYYNNNQEKFIEHRSKNKDSKREYMKKYRKEKKEQIRKTQNAWNEKNKDWYKKYQSDYGKKWRKENKEKKYLRDKSYRERNKRKIAINKKKYHKEVEMKNPRFKVKRNLRIRFKMALKRKSNISIIMFLIGCEIDYLMYHLQSQFKEGMSWDNYGDWHIDHIKPCSKFDLSDPEEQRKCFNYKNLQPLWAEENLKKGIK